MRVKFQCPASSSLKIKINLMKIKKHTDKRQNLQKNEIRVFMLLKGSPVIP